MNDTVETGKEQEKENKEKFSVQIIYNGVTKPLEVERNQYVTVVLQRAITLFGITQNPHLLSLFRLDGGVIPENETVERAGLKPGEVLLLRPNAVKGGGDVLRLAWEVVRETFRVVRECGRRECECAVYWTGPAFADLVDGVEHPVHTRSALGYQIDDGWLTEFWRRLGTSKRSVKAQVHTHPEEAFHSATDDQWPIVSQSGFISIVIPNFASGEPSLDGAWVGRLQPNGEWRQLASAAQALALA